MRTVSYRIGDLNKAVIHIGRVAENEYTRVQIDAGEIFAEYPAASVSLTVQPPEGSAYPATVTRDGNLVIWDVKDSDLTADGKGEIQLTFTNSSVVVKSAIGRISVCRSIVASGEAPDPVQDWISDATDVLEALEDAIPEGGTQGQVLAKASDEDYDLEWVDQTGGGGGTGDYNDLTNKPQINGTTLSGNNSLSDLGIASANDLSAKYTKPASGIPAEDIASGVIPVLTDLIDDTAGEGDTDVTFSADKLTSDFSDVLNAISEKADVSDIPTKVSDLVDDSGHYTKPSTGIPASDLANGVIPTVHNVPAGGSSGTVLKKASGTDYDLEWGSVAAPTDEQVADAVESWLDDHPEATTTVQDGSITKVKLNTALAEDLDSKAPGIVVESEKLTDHANLGTTSHDVIVDNTDTSFGNVIVANKRNIIDVTKLSELTKNGVTSVAQSNNTFILNGTSTGSLLRDIEFNLTGEFELSTDEVLDVKAWASKKMELQVILSTGVSSKELADRTIPSTSVGKLYSFNLASTKGAPEGTTKLTVRIRCENTGDVYNNDILWIGAYKQGTVFTDTEQLPPYTGTNNYSALSTLYYKSAVTYIADTKTYIDALDIDINEQLTYVTPEKYYGGNIPSNVDASTYIQQAIAYGIQNNVPIRCNKAYTVSTGLSITGRYADFYINSLTYTGNTGYAITVMGMRNRIVCGNITSSAGGITMYAESTQPDHYSKSNTFDIGRIDAVGHGIAITKPDGVTIVAGSNSYSFFKCLSIRSTGGNAIYLQSGSGANENRFYGGDLTTTSDYALKIEVGENIFEGFCIESACYQGIYLSASEVTFMNVRTIECQNVCDDNNRTFMKLVGTIRKNRFIGKAPSPVGIDVSDLVVPDEDSGAGSSSGWTYGIIVQDPVIEAKDFHGRASSYYYLDCYNTAVYEWAISIEGKIIFKPTGNMIINVTDATYNVYNKEALYNYFNVATNNSVITLTDSYCADGVNRVVVIQSNGYKATIVNSEGDTIFDGTDYADGTYAIDFVSEPKAYTPTTTTYYTKFFGATSNAVVSKLL